MRLTIGFTVLTLLSSWIFLVSPSAGAIAPENRLFRDLMRDYNRNIMPKMNPNERMVVSAGFSLKKIESMDEKNQIMTSFGWIGMFWKDDLLAWDPEQYNGTLRLTVSNDEIWIPEVAMYNSVDQGDDLSLDSKFRATVSPDGSVFWGPGFKWRTSCPVDLTNFPYDAQTCRVQFVNWMYGLSYLNYEVMPMYPTGLEPNNGWDVINTTSGNATIMTTEDFVGIPSMYFEVTLRRKPAYYIMNVAVPCVIISVMSLLVFLLPSEAGEKMSLAITVFLAYTVLLLMISDITPKSGESSPMITVFIVVNMGQTAVSLVLSIIVLRIFHASPLRPVPGCLRGLVLGYMARMLCMRSCTSRTAMPKMAANEQKPHGAGTPNSELFIHVRNPYIFHEFAFEWPSMRVPKVKAVTMPDDVTSFLRVLANNEKEKGKVDKIRREWENVARVLDRFFFFFFFFILTLESASFMAAIKAPPHDLLI